MLTVRPIRIVVIDRTGVAVASQVDQAEADRHASRTTLADLRACLAVPRWRQWRWRVQARNWRARDWRAVTRRALRSIALALALTVILAYCALVWAGVIWALLNAIQNGGG